VKPISDPAENITIIDRNMHLKLHPPITRLNQILSFRRSLTKATAGISEKTPPNRHSIYNLNCLSSPKKKIRIETIKKYGPRCGLSFLSIE